MPTESLAIWRESHWNFCKYSAVRCVGGTANTSRLDENGYDPSVPTKKYTNPGSGNPLFDIRLVDWQTASGVQSSLEWFMD